jgi:glucose/arabinose dehydrogenase
MTMLTRLRLIGAAVLVASAAAIAASAQTQTPAPDTQTTPPAAKPEPAPTPSTGPAMKPSSPAMPSATDKQSAAPAKNPMIGLSVFSSDGSKLGSVQSVTAGSDGKVKAIRLKTGGFLGFGGKLVEIPEGKFTKSGDNVQLGLTSDEVSKLPEVKNQS